MTFIRLQDGTTLERQDDGTYRPVQTKTDWAYLDALTDDEIDALAASDPDHPALDDAFWEDAETQMRARPEPVAIDRNVIDFFRAKGRDVDGRINAVLRDHVAAEIKRTGSSDTADRDTERSRIGA